MTAEERTLLLTVAELLLDAPLPETDKATLADALHRVAWQRHTVDLREALHDAGYHHLAKANGGHP